MYDNIQTDDIVVPGSNDRFQYYSNERSNEEEIEVRKKSIISAKIEGTYVDHLQHIVKKYQANNINLGKSIIFLDSYDGAEHSSTSKSKISVVSYSTQSMQEDQLHKVWIFLFGYRLLRMRRESMFSQLFVIFTIIKRN